IGGSSWKYQGWLDQIYMRSNYLSRGRFSKKASKAECLREYTDTQQRSALESHWSSRWLTRSYSVRKTFQGDNLRGRIRMDRLLTMSRKLLLFCLMRMALCAQNPATEAQAAALRALVDKAPKLPLERTQIKIQGPQAGWEIGYPSSVVMDERGTIYVLQ